jgi:hypothetical protein
MTAMNVSPVRQHYFLLALAFACISCTHCFSPRSLLVKKTSFLSMTATEQPLIKVSRIADVFDLYTAFHDILLHNATS